MTNQQTYIPPLFFIYLSVCNILSTPTFFSVCLSVTFFLSPMFFYPLCFFYPLRFFFGCLYSFFYPLCFLSVCLSIMFFSVCLLCFFYPPLRFDFLSQFIDRYLCIYFNHVFTTYLSREREGRDWSTPGSFTP